MGRIYFCVDEKLLIFFFICETTKWYIDYRTSYGPFLELELGCIFLNFL